MANQTVTQPVFVSHSGQLRVEQILENRTGIIDFNSVPTLASTKTKKSANRPVSLSRLSASKSCGFAPWTSGFLCSPYVRVFPR